MADYELDSLNLKVTESGTEYAIKKLQKLSQTLKTLKTSALGDSSSDSLDNIGKSADSVKNASLKKLYRLTATIKSLSSVKISARIANQITKISTAVDGLKDIDMSKFSELADGIKAMGNIKVGSMRVSAPKIETLKPQGLDLETKTAVSNIEPVKESLDTVRDKISNLSGTEIISESTTSRATKNLDKINDSAKRLRFSKIFDGARAGAKKFNIILKSSLSLLGKVAGMGFSKLSSSVKKATSKIGGFFKSIKRIATYRLIRSALKAITDGLKEGTENLYQFDKASGGSFAKSMDKITTSFLYLKNAIGTVLAPVIEKLAPVIDRIVDRFVDFINMISKAVAIMSGESTYRKALKYQTEYAEATDKSTEANKKFSKSILGIDELNVLSDRSDVASKDNTPNYSEMFTTESVGNVDFTYITDKLSQSINNFFNNYDWNELGKKIGEKFNTVIDEINNLFKKTDFANIGFSLAESISSSLEKINWEKLSETITLSLSAIGDAINGFATNFNWNALADAINEFFSGIDFDKATTDIANGLNKVISGLRKTFEEINWANIGKTFADGINGIFKLDWSNIGGLLSDGVNGILETLNSTIKNIDWKKIGNSVAEFIQGIDWTAMFENLGETVSNALTGLLDTVSGFLQKMDWSQAVSDLIDSLIGFIEKIDWSDVISSIFETIGSALGAAGGIINGLAKKIDEICSDIWQSIKDWFSKYVDWGGTPSDIIAGLWQGIKDAFSNVGQWIKNNIFQPFINGFKEAFGIHSPSTVMSEQGGYLIDGLKEGIGDIWEKIKDKFTALLTGIKDWFSNKKEDLGKAWDTFTSGIKDITATVSAKFAEGWETVTTWFGDKKDQVKNFVANAKQSASEAFTTFKKWWNGGKKATKELVADAKEKTKGTLSKFKSAWETIKTKGATLTASISDKTGKVKDTLKSVWQTVKEKSANLKASITDKSKDDLKNKLKSVWGTIKNKSGKLTASISDKTTSDVRTRLQNTWNAIYSKWSTLTANITEKGGTISKLKENWNSIYTRAVEFKTTLSDGVSNMFKALVRNICNTINQFLGWVDSHLPGDQSSWRVTVPQWAQYANGGFPPQGEMFIANEAGPELVGRIGRKTAVANQDQIVASVSGGVSQGVYEANAEQNALLREQNELLRKLLAKDNTAVITTNKMESAFDRANRRNGKVGIPVGA